MALEIMTLTAADPRRVLGDVSDARAGAWVLQVLTIAGSGTLAIKGRVTGSGVADAAAIALPYQTANRTAVAAGTAISATGIYYVPADGLDVIIERAAGTSVSVVARPVVS